MKRLLRLVACFGFCGVVSTVASTVASASVPVRHTVGFCSLLEFERQSQLSEAEAYVPLSEQSFPENLRSEAGPHPRVIRMDQQERLQIKLEQQREQLRALRKNKNAQRRAQRQDSSKAK